MPSKNAFEEGRDPTLIIDGQRKVIHSIPTSVRILSTEEVFQQSLEGR